MGSLFPTKKIDSYKNKQNYKYIALTHNAPHT